MTVLERVVTRKSYFFNIYFFPLIDDKANVYSVWFGVGQFRGYLGIVEPLGFIKGLDILNRLMYPVGIENGVGHYRYHFSDFILFELILAADSNLADNRFFFHFKDDFFTLFRIFHHKTNIVKIAHFKNIF